MQHPIITVGLAVFNAGPALELAVQSVIRQSFTSWELLIFDDGSSDGAIDSLSCLADPRIVIVRDGCNHGLSARLHQAVLMAKGQYFARMDQDDISHPERFAKQVTFLENHPAVDLLATQCITINEQELLNGVLPLAIDHADICRRPWQGFYMPHPTWMGKTEWFRRNPYPIPGPYCCEDQELLLRAHHFSCYHTLPECLLAYRIRSQVVWQKQLRTHVAMLKMQLRYFFNQGQWLNSLLSILIELARIGRDVLRELRGIGLLPSNIRQCENISLDEYHEWERLIEALKGSAGYLGIKKTKDVQT
jgi:hypothetical protein